MFELERTYEQTERGGVGPLAFEPGIKFTVKTILRSGRERYQKEFFLEDKVIEEAYKMILKEEENV